MANNQHVKPITLGLLGTGLVTRMQNQLWQGAMNAAKKHGAGLVYYPTISLSSVPAFDPQTKVLFDLVDKKSINGLLIWHAGIAEGIAIDYDEHILDQYEGIPLVTIGGQVKNRPELVIDNYQGTRTAVEHLVMVHGRRHIGIIRGPIGHYDADERYRGYVAELEAQGLPLNPDYVAQSPFELQTAAEMSEAAVNRWLQDPNRTLDAVVTASDYMAIATVKAIEARGLRVPEDISVIGFDDVDDSQANIPSITTIHQPFYDIGYHGTEMLLALVDGQSLPIQSVMPGRLVVRESCGCPAGPFVLANMTANDTSETKLDTSISPQGNPLSSLMTVASDLGIPNGHIETLVNLLRQELTSEISQKFLSTLRSYLIKSMRSQFNVTGCQNVISLLRDYVLSTSKGDSGLLRESLFDQARVLVTGVAQRAFIRERINSELQIEKLRRISEALITSFGTQLLLDTVQEHLVTLGFPSFYLSLYEDPGDPATWSHLILAYDNNQRLNLPPEGLRVPTPRLVPESMWLAKQEASMVVEPLYFRDQQLGVLVLEVGPTDGAVYETLRTQISSALQGSRLVQEVEQRAAELEQRVSERTTELTQTVDLLQTEIAERKRAEESLNKAEEANRTFSERLKELFAVSVELSQIDQMDELCRKAIELGRSRLKFDRLSLWFNDPDPEFQVGSYGIDEEGNIRDERDQRVQISQITDHFKEFTEDDRRVYYRDSGELYNDKREVIGRGWLAAGTLLDGSRMIGILSVDNLLSLTPIEPYQLELLALYSATLGNLVTRMHAEATLRDSEERYRALYHENPSLLFTLDASTKVVSVNEHGARQLGYTIDELVGRPVLELFFEADQETVTAQLQLCLQNPLRTYRWQLRNVRKDGSILWVEENARVIRGGDGSLQVLIVCQDITERTQTEDALRVSEARLREVVRAGNIGIFDHDHMTDSHYWSTEQRHIYGWGPEEVVTIPTFLNVLHPEDRERIAESMKHAHDPAGDGGFDVEHRIFNRSGAIRWLSVRSRTFFEGEAGTRHPVRTIGATVDITERKAIEEAIRTSEHKYRTLVEQASDGIFVTDSDDHYIEVNQSGCEMSGYSRDELLTFTITDLMPLEDVQTAPLQLEALRAGKTVRSERLMRRKDGTELSVEISARTRTNGQLQAIVRDITERKQMEQDLLLTQFSVDHASVGIMRIGPDARILSANQQCCQSLGYTAQELCNLHIYDLDTTFPVERWIEHQSHIRRQGTDTFETVHRRKDGTTFPVEITTTYVSFQSTEFAIGFILDITERKQMLEALQLNSFAVERASDAVYWIDSDTIITNVNEAASQMLGYSRAEFIGKSVAAIDPTITLDEIKEIWVVVKQEKTLTFESQHRTKDGHVFPVEIAISHISSGGKELNCAFVRNITERRQAEETLARERNLLRAVIDHLPDNIYVKDREGKFILNNSESIRILGASRQEDLFGKSDFDFFPHDLAAQWLIEHQAVMESGEPNLNVEAFQSWNDGERRWVVGSTIPFYNDSGKVVGLVGINRDITERKQADNRFRALLESAPDAIVIVDQTGNIVLVNTKTEMLFGYRRDELLGQPVEILIPERFHSRHPAHRGAYVADPHMRGMGVGLELFALRKDGSQFPVEISLSPIETAEGVVIASAVRDSTERKHTEEALRKSEEHAHEFQEKLKALQEISFELAAIESPKQMCHRAIELGHSGLGFDRIGLLVYDNAEKSKVSRFGIESTGELRVEQGMSYSAEEERNDSSLMNREPVQVSEDATLHNFEGDVSLGRGWNVMAGIRDASTNIGWLAADNFFDKKPLIPYQLELLKLYGLTLGHLLTRKRAEAEIRELNDELEQRVIARTKELQEANEEIRHFAYIVSHDLRAPLVNLKGFSGELRSALKIVQDGCDEVVELVDPTTRDSMSHALQEDIPEALKFIESAVDNMDSFTKAILRLSRLGRLQLDPIAVDIRTIVAKTLETLTYQINQQRIRVKIGDLPVVTADLVSMEQIFGNILSNAVAYLVPGRPGEIEISAESTDDEAIIHIRDNGRGIAKEDMDKVFAPFRRAGKQDVPGEGMGMAYVQTLVRRHGGRIWCDSEVGSGTTFTFTVPKNLTYDPTGS